MEALKFELFTPTGFFKTPLSLKGLETYPLPPYSTSIGLLYTAVGKGWEGESFSLSVQGNYETFFRDYVRLRKYNVKDKIIQTLPLEIPILYNLRLTVHILGEKDVLGAFEKGLRGPSTYLYLSGGEFPVKVASVKRVSVQKRSFNLFELKKNCLVPEKLYTSFEPYLDIKGIYFRMPGFLKSLQPREHEWVDVYFLQRGSKVAWCELLIDEEGEPVWV